MDNARCKNCQYYKSYYHGFGVGSVMFSHRCWWTGRDPSNVNDEDCPLTAAHDERTIVRKEMIP